MKVSDLAKILNTTSEDILNTLKALRLKAKDEDQELNAIVLDVLRREYSKPEKKKSIIPPPAPKPERPKWDRAPVSTPETETPAKETAKKRVAKKTAKKEAAEPETAEEKPVKKRAVKKAATEEVQTPAVEPKPEPEKVEEKPEVKPEAKVEEKPAVEEKKPEPAAVPKEEVRPAAEIVKKKKKISKEPLITLTPLKQRSRKDRFVKPEVTEEGQIQTEPIGVSSGAGIPIGQTLEEALAQRPLQEVEVDLPITVKDLSVKIQQKPSTILAFLMKLGVFAHINQSLEKDMVERIMREYGYSLAKVRTQEEQMIEEHQEEVDAPETLRSRPPVITVMGHVDHGKTTLLDYIRKSNVADTEHGGITQHMSAYSVDTRRGRITFLDTPGHEAFTSMRARSAHITDIVILVVAADEGVMPQTLEAIDHARAAEVPIVVALNKIDKRNADPDRVKKQLADIDLMPEDWGGKTITVPVSAVSGEGVDNLLEMILLEAELLELKANPDKKATGIIVEANLSQGKGVITTLIVQRGSLHEGDYIVVGAIYGKVKAMFDDHERQVKEAGPSMPVKILGLPDVPVAGESFYVVVDERQAREIVEKRQEAAKTKRLQSMQRMTLEDLYQQTGEGRIKELNVIIKADVQGSLEALRDSLAKIPSDKVRMKFIHCGVGDINASDVVLAVASKAVIIAFQVGIDNRARQELEKTPVEIKQYRIIYDAVNEIKNALEGLLEAKKVKNFIGRIEIREVFKLSKSGIVAGCYVQKGKFVRRANVDVIRGGQVIFSGVLSSLKRFKDDVKEVTDSMECGLTIQGFSDYQKGDIVEAYEIKSIAQKL
jgi:translation initiation factor IF-2